MIPGGYRFGRRVMQPKVFVVMVLVLAMGGLLAACSSSPKKSSSAGSSATTSSTTSTGPVSGGTLKVLSLSGGIGGWPVGLDPATDTSGPADTSFMDAIYGDMFETGANGQLIPDLATGYKFSGPETVTITLRKGVNFTDGTPFNSAAVKSDYQRLIKDEPDCLCGSTFPVSSIDTPDPYTVVLHLSVPFSPIMASFPESAPNWIESPTAFQKMGEKAFAKTPVGAGPFEVVSDEYSTKLVLKKNPNYWQAGRPYLDGLVFSTIGNDQSAYDAILTGEDNMEVGFGTYSLLATVKKHLNVQADPGAGPIDVELNTTTAPFNNILARQALIYATNPAPIAQAITLGAGIVTQSPSSPGSLVYEPTVAGYPSYNLAKAKALVKQLGGLTMTLYTSSTGPDLQVGESLQTQWRAAGINVNLKETSTLQATLGLFKSNNWQGMIQGVGGQNPFTLGVGGSLLWRAYSKGPFTGVKDPHLDSLINQALQTTNTTQVKSLVTQMFSYIAQKAYFDILYAAPLYNISQKTVHGPGITSARAQLQWENAWIGKS